MRAESPPEVLAAARREPAETLPSEPDSNLSFVGTTLPPPSSDPNEAIRRAQRRAYDAKDAELERARRENQKLELELEIERERARSGGASGSIPPKGWSDPKILRAVLGLIGVLTTLGATVNVWLATKASSLETAQERQAERAKDATATASSAKAESRDATKELDELRKQLAAERVYNREVLRRLGIVVPKREGDPEPPQLEVEVPLRKPGTVTPGAVLIVKTLPP